MGLPRPPCTRSHLPGPPGQRFDYLAIDEEDSYVVSAHLGPGPLCDTNTNTVVKTIQELPRITGVEYITGLHKAYTSNWGEEKLGVIDLRTMSVIKRLATDSKPNGIVCPEPFRKAYVVNTLGKGVSAVDINKDKVVRTLRFHREAGTPGYDSVAKKIYVTLRSTNAVAEVGPCSIRLPPSLPSRAVDSITAWRSTQSTTGPFRSAAVPET